MDERLSPKCQKNFQRLDSNCMIIPHSADLLEYFKINTYAPKHLFLKIDYFFYTCIRNILPLRHFEKSLITVFLFLFFNCLLFSFMKELLSSDFLCSIAEMIPPENCVFILTGVSRSIDLCGIVSGYVKVQ